MFKKKSVIPVIIILCLCVLLVNFQRRRYSTRSKIVKPQDEIEILNQKIKRQGLDWVAGETSMTRLAPAERKKMLGNFTPTFIDPTQFAEIESIGNLAAALDWRNNGGDFMSGVRDQGQCGSCWTFGPIGVMEAMYNIETGGPSGNPDLSEQHLLSCSGAGTCGGGNDWNATAYILSTGVSPEACFPYAAADNACSPCAGWPANKASIAGQAWITQAGFIQSSDPTITSIAAIAAKLTSRGPLVGNMTVYPSFYNYTDGVYSPTDGEAAEGGHCIVICGYDDSDDSWICKNSWGSGWGVLGYFKIARQPTTPDVDIGDWVFEMWGVSLQNVAPVLTAVGHKTVKEGEDLSFTLSATDADGNALAYTCTNQPTGATFSTATGAFAWTPSYTQGSTPTDNTKKVYSVTFTVSDGIATDSETINITVTNRKHAKGRF